MAEDKITNDSDMPDSEQISELEKDFVDILSAAEQGDEERRKFLNELPAEQIGELYKVFKPSTMLRLAEYYCLSFETAIMAAVMASVITKDLKKFVLSYDIQSERVTGMCMLAYVFPYADRQRDDDEKCIEARAHISALATDTDARKGYALAQYWMGRMAEDGINYDGGHHLARAVDWYRKAAEQGVIDAKKRLPEVSKRLEEDVRQWRMEFGKCTYCAGKFKGIFRKICRECGKPKDY